MTIDNKFNELVDILYINMVINKNFKNRDVFGKNNFGKNIGQKILDLHDTECDLFTTMRLLTERIMYNEDEYIKNHINYYYTDLRQLEFCFSELNTDFQA